MTRYNFRLFVLTSITALLFGLIGNAHGDSIAGYSTEVQRFNFPAATQDIVVGDTYYYVENESVVSTISTRIASNNNPGTFQRGYVMDLVLKTLNTETLDWTQFIIAGSILDGWNYPENNVVLETLAVQDGQAVTASGYWLNNPDIQVAATYEMLETAPILRITVDITNTGQSDFAGFFEYQVDPDGSGNQNAYVPGLGWNPGLITSGWTDNYVYDGPETNIAMPGHGIAWYVDSPVAINAPGYIFGLWFDISVVAGETKSITFYHITEDPSLTTDPYAGIAEWAQILPTLDQVTRDEGIIHGEVTNSTTGEGIPNATVAAKNIHAEIKGITTSLANGTYSIILPPDSYTLEVSTLGYESASNLLNMADGPTTYTTDFDLTPISVWVGLGKRLLGPLAQGTETDIVMENHDLAISIAVTSEDPQLPNATMGKPLDLAVTGLTDGIDWLNLPYISLTQPQGPEAWQITSLINYDVEIIENNDLRAVVKVTGSYTGVRGVDVVTFYTIEPDQPWIYAETQVINHSSLNLDLWIGDVIDNDENGQTSYVPGTDDINITTPQSYTPSLPWIAQYGSSDQCFGLVYEGDYADFTAYGTNGWIQSQKRVSVPNGTTYSLKRYIVAAPTTGLERKSLAVEDVFYEVSDQETGLNLELIVDDSVVQPGQEILVTLQLHNSSEEIRQGYQAVLELPESLTTDDPLEIVIDPLESGATVALSWSVTAVTGGRADVFVRVEKLNQYPRTRKATVFISGPGWYTGDNHTHSTWSDGSGTIAQNVASAKQKGLDFLTCTDHNTINQATDVEAQNTGGFVAILGEEVTSSYGHSLAYNITSLINWTLPAQQMIDSVNANNQGQGFLYIAHPYYPNIEWDHWEVTDYAGIEVWNGFYAPTHSVNSRSFEKWDQLNAQGYHLNGIANSDAHNVNKIGDPHICAYLNELSRDEIIRAMREGTFYGTNGPELHFTIDGQIMGSNIHVSRSAREVSIRLGGSYTEPITSLQLIKNGVVLKSWTPNTTSVTETTTDIAISTDFYRVIVQTQTGYAFSNPIWIVQ